MALSRDDIPPTKIVSAGRKASGGRPGTVSGVRVEAAIGIEPMCGGFADLCLTACLRRGPGAPGEVSGGKFWRGARKAVNPEEEPTGAGPPSGAGPYVGAG